MIPAQKIWLNGAIVPLEKAKIFCFHQGINYGACVYEGIRFYKTSRGPAIFRLHDHANRFFYSASALRMNLGITKKGFEDAVKGVIVANALTSGYVRPMAFYSEAKMGINILGAAVTVVIFVWPWKDGTEEKPVTMKIVTIRRLDPRTVDLKAKISGYYANGLLGFIEARKDGFDQPLFLDTKGFIAEGAVNNIFIAKNNALYTPKLGSILGGITRNTIIEIARDIGVNVFEKNILPDVLRAADEVFLTGTGIELERVSRIRGHFKQRRISQSICSTVQHQYREAALGVNEKYRKWLSMVY